MAFIWLYNVPLLVCFLVSWGQWLCPVHLRFSSFSFVHGMLKMHQNQHPPPNVCEAEGKSTLRGLKPISHLCSPSAWYPAPSRTTGNVVLMCVWAIQPLCPTSIHTPSHCKQPPLGHLQAYRCALQWCSIVLGGQIWSRHLHRQAWAVWTGSLHSWVLKQGLGTGYVGSYWQCSLALRTPWHVFWGCDQRKNRAEPFRVWSIGCSVSR